MDVGLCVPLEGACCEGGVYAAAELLARLGRAVVGCKIFARDTQQQIVEAVHAGLDARADVVGARGYFVLEGEHVGAGYVSDVDIVAGLVPAAIYRGGFAPGEVTAEDRHDPGFPVRVLPGPVDVGVAERDVGHSEVDVVVVHVAFARELGDPVRRNGVERVVLGGRQHPLLAVDGPTRGGEDDFLYSVVGAILEETDRSEDVDLGVEVRLPDRAPHVHLGGLVAERLGLEVPEDLPTTRADVGLVESRPFRYVLAFARREVVDDGDLVPPLEQEPGHVRSDKPGSPGQKHPHLSSPVLRTKPVSETRTRPGTSRVLRGPRSAAPTRAILWHGLCRGDAAWHRPREEAGVRSRCPSRRAL